MIAISFFSGSRFTISTNFQVAWNIFISLVILTRIFYCIIYYCINVYIFVGLNRSDKFCPQSPCPAGFEKIVDINSFGLIMYRRLGMSKNVSFASFAIFVLLFGDVIFTAR